MVPTKRLAAFAAIAALLAVVAGYAGAARVPLFALDAAIVAATLADALLVRGRRIEVSRQVAAIFSVGRPNVVTLELRNVSARRLRGVVADDPLADATVAGLPAAFDLPPRGNATLRYELTPTRRGRRDFHAISVRYASPLGLVDRQERAGQDAVVDVYPDVHAARSLELLRRQGRKDARLGSLRVRGGDTEFERLRPYQRGD